jgi:hypothetical protein
MSADDVALASLVALERGDVVCLLGSTTRAAGGSGHRIGDGARDGGEALGWLSAVIATELWPSWSETTFGGTPASRATPAAVYATWHIGDPRSRRRRGPALPTRPRIR